MLLAKENEISRSKCFFTNCDIPSYLDEHRPPTKKQPFVAMNSNSPAHTIELIIPEELYADIRDRLDGGTAALRYARVHMSLLDIVSGDFFNQYIKAGSILMLSEGRLGLDNTFFLHQGTLRLELDKATYERSGLVGNSIPDQGRKHVKSRFAVELDLRLPSMLHGKKGFERIVWAFKNVLNQSITWLFADLSHPDIESGPITKHHPQTRTVTPQMSEIKDLIVPIVNTSDAIADPDYEEQLLEWLGLVSLQCPRICQNDNIDRYLCRYDLPDAYIEEEHPQSQAQTVVQLRWHGFASASFVVGIWLMAKSNMGAHWFALNVGALRGSSYTILCSRDREVLLWEYQ